MEKRIDAGLFFEGYWIERRKVGRPIFQVPNKKTETTPVYIDADDQGFEVYK